MADVFISYKSERRAAAEHLAEILAGYGYSVWWDSGLVAGRDFRFEIEKELRAAKAVVVLWCSLSVRSDWVCEEAELAKRLSKLIPTVIEEGVNPPFGFLLAQTLDLSEWDGAPLSSKLARLLHDIGRFVGRAVEPNFERLASTERAWRQLGALSLREYWLIGALEGKMPEHAPGAPFARAEYDLRPTWAALDKRNVVTVARFRDRVGFAAPGSDLEFEVERYLSDLLAEEEANTDRTKRAHFATPPQGVRARHSGGSKGSSRRRTRGAWVGGMIVPLLILLMCALAARGQ